ncbi:MAG: CRISPR system precrRNA processing endoribonuclease RAMP protein Cas6 [Christensenellaceae bacterium]|jgi:CRISPR-associated endoribonuclease Cas6|nr:CRISPR system precrRNA processing endoribonuclease RAMP protein Cas6 [Christensenellaceae bacterium]
MQTYMQFEITLRPEGELFGWLGHLLHGALFAQLAKAGPPLATRIHAGEKKPFSLYFSYQGGLVTLHLNAWDDELCKAIPTAFSVGTRLLLSRTEAQVERFALRQELNWRADPAEFGQFRLHFISPTCFRPTRQTLLFPEGEYIIESLTRSTGLALNGEAGQFLQPLRYSLHTEAVNFKLYSITGFLGWAEYAIAANAPAELQAELRALPYTGLGYKTTQGLGAVRIEPAI